jgi:hypothetical protein
MKRDFAGEALVADAAVMRDISQPKRTALLACLVHEAHAQARDDLAEMYCRRVGSPKRADTELDEIRAEGQEISERLIEYYRDVPCYLDPRGSRDGDGQSALELARATAERRAGSTPSFRNRGGRGYRANNCVPLIARQTRLGPRDDVLIRADSGA